MKLIESVAAWIVLTAVLIGGTLELPAPTSVARKPGSSVFVLRWSDSPHFGATEVTPLL